MHQATDTGGAYANYVAWKQWDKPFTYSAELANYFEGEMRGVAVKGADLLEIGFGSGAFLAWAKSKGARVSGVEIIPELVTEATRRGIPLLPEDLEAIAATTAATFDTIVAFDVFEHLTAEVVAMRLATCARLLRQGGHLVLRFPNGQSPFGLPPQGGDPTHKSRLSRSGIEQLMGGTGFKVVRYGPSFRVKGGGLATGLVRRLRYFARDLITHTLNAIYAENIPWDAVVVIVLTKT